MQRSRADGVRRDEFQPGCVVRRRLARQQRLDGLAQRGRVCARLGPQRQVAGARIALEALVVGLKDFERVSFLVLQTVWPSTD